MSGQFCEKSTNQDSQCNCFILAECMAVLCKAVARSLSYKQHAWLRFNELIICNMASNEANLFL